MSTTDGHDRHLIELRVPPKAEYLVLCRLVLAGIGQALDLQPEVLRDLKLAVTEACSNAIRHAYSTVDEGEVAIRFAVAPDEIVIDVVDQGSGFDVERELERRRQPDEEGMMGIAIIRAVVDRLSLDRPGGGRGSRVRMVKSL